MHEPRAPGAPSARRSAPLASSPPRSIQRIRDKYQTELAELERSERQLQERCAQLRGRLGEAEGESARLRGLLQRRERELADTRKVSAQARARAGRGPDGGCGLSAGVVRRRRGCNGLVCRWGGLD